jgi:hypothetical protein
LVFAPPHVLSAARVRTRSREVITLPSGVSGVQPTATACPRPLPRSKAKRVLANGITSATAGRCRNSQA